MHGQSNKKNNKIFHLYLDGSYSSKFNDMGAGAVLVDVDGKIVAESSTSLVGKLATDSGYELFALTKGLQLLEDIEYCMCFVYSDNRSLVHDLLHRPEVLKHQNGMSKNPELFKRLERLLSLHAGQLVFRWQSDKMSEGLKRAHVLARHHIKRIKNPCFNIKLNGGYVPVMPRPRQLEYHFDDCGAIV